MASIEVTNGQESFTVVAFGDGRVQLPSAGAWQLRRRVDSFPDGCSAEAVAEVTVVSCDDVCPEHGAVPADHAH